MSANHRHAIKADAKRSTAGAFTFVTDGTTDPSVTSDPNGIISSITEASTGTFTVTLTDKFANLYAVAQHGSITYGAQVTATSASSGTITVKQTLMSSHAANAASDGDTVTVVYFANH